MSDEKIDKIEAVAEKSVATEKAAPPVERAQPNKEHFDTLMGGEEKMAGSPTAPKDPSKTTLMDTVRDLNYTEAKAGGATNASIVSQTQEAITQISQIKKALESPNANIKRSAQQLLQNKLTHIDESLKIALSKAGIEYSPSAAVQSPTFHDNPIGRFLSFLTDGQWQLEKLGNELAVMGRNSKELSPVNMLAVQVKVSQIQQELELFSSLLNKGLESLKTIMNVQV